MTDLKSPVPDPVPGAQAPAVSRVIYGMPMFATLLTRDIRASVSWYTRGLGFIELFTMPGPDGEPMLVHLRRWQFQDLLLRPAREPVTAGSGCTLSFAAVYDEIDALAERARAHGGGRVDGAADTPWNTRDLATADPDGNMVIFTAARPPQSADAAFSGQMRQWSREQGLDQEGRLPARLGGNGGARERYPSAADSALRPRMARGTGILDQGKPCAATVSFRGTIFRAPVDLVGGHTGGTFYIRARLRAGACVPVDSETLGRCGPLRVVEPLAVWTLSLAVQIHQGVGC